MKASSNLGWAFSWRSLSRELRRTKPEILSKRILEAAPETCVAPANFFLEHASAGIPFWVPVVQGKGRLLAFVLTCEKEGPDKVILAGPDRAAHPFREKRQALGVFLSKWLGLPGTWSLIAGEPAKTAISQDSWRLPLYYAARAAALGLRVRLDLALTGDMEQGALSLLSIGGITEKLAAARGLRLSGLVVPKGDLENDDLLFAVDDITAVDACYEGYFGPVSAPGEDRRSWGQRESDWRVSRLLAGKAGQATAPGRLSPPAVGLVGPILPKLRGAVTGLSESDNRETEPCSCDWDQAVADVARIAEDVAVKGKPFQVSLHPDCGALFFESYFQLRKEWREKRDLIYMESPEDLRCATADAIPVTFNGHLPPGPGISFHLLDSRSEEELKGNIRQLIFSPAETTSDPLPRDDWGRRVLVERAEVMRQWLSGTYPPIEGPIVERDWLKKDIREWLSEPKAPTVLLLEADPGWGKTTFAASLAKSEVRISARYFCDPFHKDGLGFARSIVAQLSRCVSEVDTALQDRERLEGCRCPSDYLTQMVLQPLVDTTISPVVLVDSIHEAPEIGELIKELVRCAPMPLRFIVTSWPKSALRASLPAQKVLYLPLSQKGKENQKDLLDYLLIRLRENDLPQVPGTIHKKAAVLAAKADGLFAYAAFAMDWLAEAQEPITLESLPSGMNGLYAKWFESQSWVKSNWESPGGKPGLRDLFGLLCIAEARPTKAHLQAWLGDGVTELDRWLIEASAFIREVDGTYGLFHHTARQWFMESYEKNHHCVDQLKAHRHISGAGLRFGKSSGKRASDWADRFIALRDGKVEPGEEPILNYYLSHLPSHLIQSGQEENLRAAEALLTNFDFQMLRCGITGEGAYSTIEEIGRLLGMKGVDGVLGQKRVDGLRVWRSFFRGNAHILRRGEPRWPTYKILLQLAVEHADDSQVTKAAEKWLGRKPGPCDWLWLRNPRHKDCVARSHRPIVFEGHTAPVKGAMQIDDGRILSWAQDGIIILWSATGIPQQTIRGRIQDAIKLPDGHVLWWSEEDCDLWLWAVGADEPEPLKGHTRQIRGVKVTPGGKVLSWSADCTLRLWDLKSRKSEELKGHRWIIDWVGVSTRGRIASLDRGSGTLRLWSAEGKLIRVLSGRKHFVDGALFKECGRIVTWSTDKVLRLWSVDGKLARAKKAPFNTWSAVCLPSSPIVALIDEYNSLYLWNTVSGELRSSWGNCESLPADHRVACPWRSATHTGFCNTHKLTAISKDCLVSWPKSGPPRVVDPVSGRCIRVLAGESEAVSSVWVLSSGKLLSRDKVFPSRLMLWTLKSDDPPKIILDGEATDLSRVYATVSHENIFAWGVSHGAAFGHGKASDGVIRIYDSLGGQCLGTIVGHVGPVGGVQAMPEHRLLSWSADHTLRLWDTAETNIYTNFDSHEAAADVVVSKNGRDWWSISLESVRQWDITSGKCKATFNIPLDWKWIIWEATVLPGDRLLAWGKPGGLRLFSSANGECSHVLDVGPPEFRRQHALVLKDRRIVTLLDHECQLQVHDASVMERLEVFGDEWKIPIHYAWGFLEQFISAFTIGWGSKATLQYILTHESPIQGFTRLSSGRILSWCSDGNFYLWQLPIALAEGNKSHRHGVPTLLGTYPEQEALNTHPDLVAKKALASRTPAMLTTQLAGWQANWATKGGRLSLSNELVGTNILWHSNYGLKSQALRSEGTVVVTTESGDVLFLKLQDGRNRRTLASAYASLSSPRASLGRFVPRRPGK